MGSARVRSDECCLQAHLDDRSNYLPNLRWTTLGNKKEMELLAMTQNSFFA